VRGRGSRGLRAAEGGKAGKAGKAGEEDKAGRVNLPHSKLPRRKTFNCSTAGGAQWSIH
jgi:hypothetical protein